MLDRRWRFDYPGVYIHWISKIGNVQFHQRIRSSRLKNYWFRYVHDDTGASFSMQQCISQIINEGIWELLGVYSQSNSVLTFGYLSERISG